MHKNNFVTQAFCSVEDHFSNWPFKILLLCAELQDHVFKEVLDALYEKLKLFSYLRQCLHRVSHNQGSIKVVHNGKSHQKRGWGYRSSFQWVFFWVSLTFVKCGLSAGPWTVQTWHYISKPDGCHGDEAEVERLEEAPLLPEGEEDGPTFVFLVDLLRFHILKDLLWLYLVKRIAPPLSSWLIFWDFTIFKRSFMAVVKRMAPPLRNIARKAIAPTIV